MDVAAFIPPTFQLPTCRVMQMLLAEHGWRDPRQLLLMFRLKPYLLKLPSKMCWSSNRPDPPAAERSRALPPIPAVLGSRFIQSYPGILKQIFCRGKEHSCRIRTQRRNFILAGREIKYPNRLFPSLISVIHGILMILSACKTKVNQSFLIASAALHH